MSSAVLTLIGLYNYDHTLFDNMVMPDGVDKSLVIDAILMTGGEYEVMYPNPDLLKEMIGSWSNRWERVFYNWKRAADDMDKINPLDNYDRYEDWEDNGESHSKSIDVMNGSGQTSGSDSSHGTASVNNDITNTSKISADDSSNFVNKTQDITDNTQSNTTNTNSSKSTSSSTNTNSTADTDGTTKSLHTGHIRGNIGVTTSATMWREFVDTMRQYGNIYDTIAVVFCQSFVIPIL